MGAIGSVVWLWSFSSSLASIVPPPDNRCQNLQIGQPWFRHPSWSRTTQPWKACSVANIFWFLRGLSNLSNLAIRSHDKFYQIFLAESVSPSPGSYRWAALRHLVSLHKWSSFLTSKWGILVGYIQLLWTFFNGSISPPRIREMLENWLRRRPRFTHGVRPVGQDSFHSDKQTPPKTFTRLLDAWSSR